MKKQAGIFKRPVSLFAVFLLFCSCMLYGKDMLINFADLPEKAQSYVKAHFPDAKPVKVEKEKDGLSVKYELKLDNMIDLDFNSKGEITGIDGNLKLPDSVIPEKILEYVKKNYPDNHITDWNLEKKTQEVELDNGLELKFDLKGKFLRMDK
ncbi:MULTISPECIES: PepSY-like domain-containing protein [unclassified Treponema]|uniref:PepSY-like domain-containing protein n=1 Tax=unclassified Treponema TaxID=2638727 RepID=UPI0020A51951|nr:MULTISPECIES: PepSY-like domain-containing protein [unclassified Treponema]UTC67797.1 PepSY-like domain-containing protein [Treponema sp. OMZ 789]UTC70522.1 PepSY-like domain-containing protein [Treponema sp. OMZ 790]UTC73234.1 PepSY-like domain-containing protein [Treponema sp. OMZ 791]